MRIEKTVGLIALTLILVGCGGSPKASYSEETGKVENPYILPKSEQLIALTNYFLKQELNPEKPFFPSQPEKPRDLAGTNLVKGKYEKTEDFEARVSRMKEDRVQTLRALEKKYAKDVKAYNAEVKRLTDNYNNTIATRQKNIKAITLQSMQKAYAVVYGTPYVKEGLTYDADSETFYGKVGSTKGGFEEKVSIKVPLDQAQAFEKARASLDTNVIFDYVDGKLKLQKIDVKYAQKSYVAVLSDVNFKSENMSVAINEGSLQLPAAPILSASFATNTTEYDVGQIVYSKDPEVARLQKIKFELEQKERAKKRTEKEREAAEQKRAALEAQIALLEQKKGGEDDISKLLADSSSHAVDNTKWLFAIAIENYEYTDPVAYSTNSAKQFKAVMKKRLGIPEKNIRMLVNRDATTGKISHDLNDLVSHVKAGDTIYFYYSGHGIPVPAQENAPYLLAQDMSPAYVADDERFKMQTIYMSLSKSKASKVVAFVDSCFSGGNDNQALVKGVAATRLKPKSVTFDKQKMLVISAGSGTQYSNKYDEKSNRLFSYYVMRGLIKNNADTQRLYDYVKSNVQEKSYEMGSSYEQVPVFDGNIGLEL